MFTEYYNYLDYTDTQYFFESEGRKGKILKSVVFTPLENNICNLGFGDWQKGDIDDSVITNNYDIVKLFNTIAKIAYEYSEKFPKQILFINPVDDKRKQLYNHIFRRHYEAIEAIFDIMGNINGKYEAYSPKKNYDDFKLKRKFV